MQPGQEALDHCPGDQFDPTELRDLIGVKQIRTLYHESRSPVCTAAVQIKIAGALGRPEIHQAIPNSGLCLASLFGPCPEAT